MTPDLYTVLGVIRTASFDDIKKAYRQLSLLRHPDVGGSTEQMVELNAAYEVLCDASKRAGYDRTTPPPRTTVPASPPPRRPMWRGMDAQPPTRMPWGRHASERLSSIDLNYLVWVLTKATATKRYLAQDIRTELQKRDVRMPTTDEDGDYIGDIVNDPDAWRAFCRQKGW